MNSRWCLFSPLAVALLASSAAAHFVWITVESDSGGQPQAQVHFGELAEPDSAALLDNVAKVQVWAGAAAEKGEPLKLSKHITDEVGSWVAAVPAGTRAVSGSVNYGVLDRRGQVFLLMYHARYLDAAANLKAIGRDERLPLDVVPEISGGQCVLQVLFEGKPVAGSEVVLLDPEGNEQTKKTDESGKVTVDGTKPGLHSIRAKWVVEKAGEHEGKKYAQVNHYSTLALRVPQPTK
jgi:uncharacterized GH25 family protein